MKQDKPLAGKTAIITGASRGIGRAAALRLAADGADVVINYRTRAPAADEVMRRIMEDRERRPPEEQGGGAITVPADMADTADVRRLFDAAMSRFGGVDILVNNAGIALGELTALADVTDEQYDRLFAVNTRGVFMALREAAVRLNDGGRIINLSTTVIPMALPGYSLYAGTKAAVEIFTRILARELGHRQITVNAVAPGPVETELFRTGKSEGVIQRMAAMAPLNRLGQPDDIADIIAFLAGDQGRWISGQIIRANGGMA